MTKIRVFVDTNIIRYYFEDVPSAIIVIKDILDSIVEGYTSTIVEMELYSLSNADDEWFNDVNTILSLFKVIPVSRSIARRAGLMRKALFNQGIKRDEIMFADCLIASTGVELDAVVLSANRKDFVHLEQFGVKWQNPING